MSEKSEGDNKLPDKFSEPQFLANSKFYPSKEWSDAMFEVLPDETPSPEARLSTPEQPAQPPNLSDLPEPPRE